MNYSFSVLQSAYGLSEASLKALSSLPTPVIEYTVPGLANLALSSGIGLTYGKDLKSYLTINLTTSIAHASISAVAMLAMAGSPITSSAVALLTYEICSINLMTQLAVLISVQISRSLSPILD